MGDARVSDTPDDTVRRDRLLTRRRAVLAIRRDLASLIATAEQGAHAE